MLVFKIIFITLFPETLTLASWCFWDIMLKISESESHSVVSNSLQPHGLYSPLNSPGQNTGMGNLSLLQGSSQLRDQTQAMAGRFFTI